MKKINLTTIMMLFFMMLIPFLMFGQTIEIQVSPNVLNLQNNGEVVTIHTDIPYSYVVGSTVTLNGLEIDHWKSDNQGYFVAKFNMDEVKELEGLEIGGYNTLTLEGTNTDGETFSGSEDILVVNNIPKGKS